MLKRYTLILCTCCSLTFLPCCSKSVETHKMYTYPWLQEQVEQGKLTTQQADEIEAQMNKLHSK